MNNKDQFEPIHSAHAIEQVVCVIQFDKPIEKSAFNEVRKLAEPLKSELPGVQETQGLPIQLGAFVPATTNFPNGLIYRKIQSDGAIEAEFRIEANLISFRTMVYTRWDNIWKQACKYFNTVISPYSQNTNLSLIGLNYVDKFRWQGDASSCQPKQLLRPNSPYISPHVYELNDLWHCHTGAFKRVDDHIKRLYSMNIDFIDENVIGQLNKTIVINTIMNDMFNQPGYTEYKLDPSSIVAFYEQRFNDLHTFNKELLGDILSEAMSKRIALKA